MEFDHESYLMEGQQIEEGCRLYNIEQLTQLIKQEELDIVAYWGGSEEKTFCYQNDILSVDMQHINY